MVGRCGRGALPAEGMVRDEARTSLACLRQSKRARVALPTAPAQRERWSGGQRQQQG